MRPFYTLASTCQPTLSTDALNIIDIANEFVGDSEHRLTVFGKFQQQLS